jgi:hypothetical protein
VAALVLAAVFLAIYVPDVGHGFIKDDFAWIRNSRVAEPGGLLALFGQHVGFYRPLVSVSFAFDHMVWGLDASGYAATNVALLVANAGLLFALARRLMLPAAAALFGVAAWVFNFHGVNMALLWISGRTSLLVTLFALATALAWLRDRRVLAALFALAAMLCKEEAVLLPVLFGAFARADRQHAPTSTLRLPSLGALRPVTRALGPSFWPLWVALVAYLLLRERSGAFGPADAPPFYRFAFAPTLLLRNALEYLDRAVTLGAALALILLAVCRWHRATPAADERRALIFAACWLPATYALTVFLPIRSSLYALLPSVATGLAVAAIAARARRANAVAFRRAAIALTLVAMLLVPVYWSRNQRWVTLADLSAQAIETIRDRASGVEPGLVVLVDDPGERVNLDAAFGSLLPEALELELGPGWNGAIVAAGRPLPEPRVLTLALRDGRLVQLP